MGTSVTTQPETEQLDLRALLGQLWAGKSWIIGDRTVDVETGRRAGTKTILVRTGFGGTDGKCNATPDATCDDLKQAVAMILDQ